MSELATYQKQESDPAKMTAEDLRLQLAEGEALLARLAETLQGGERNYLQGLLTVTKTLDAIEVEAWPLTGTGELLVQQAHSAGYGTVVDYITRDGFDVGGVKWTSKTLSATLHVILGTQQERCHGTAFSTS
jgi:hypothetical protein